MHINGEDISNLNDYLEIFKEIKKENYYYIFRGQSRDEWGLIPKIARNPFNDDKPYEEKKDAEDKEKEIERHLNSKMPAYGYDFNSLEGTDRIWRTMIIAQHNGIPTRMLDFTRNPLIALFFACKSNKNSDKNHSGILWGIKLNIVDKQDPIKAYSDILDEKINYKKFDGVIAPPLIDKRIIAQDSVFYVCKEMITPLETMLESNNNIGDSFIKIDINGNSFKEEILTDLYSIGVNDYTIFPDMFGLKEYLKWRIYFLKSPHTY